MYRVQITLTVERDGARRVIQVPMFDLDEDILGIVSEAHAMRIAETIVNPTCDPAVTVNGDTWRVNAVISPIEG